MFYNNRQLHINTKRGFTLIEMIVSIAIFMTVATVAIGALLKVVDANKKAQSIKTSITNLNFVLDAMTRELRVGTKYNCNSGVVTPTSLTTAQACTTALADSWSIAFNSSKIAYDGGGNPCSLIKVYSFDKTTSTIKKGDQETCNGTYTMYPILYGATSANDPNATDAMINFSAGTVRVVTANVQPYVQLHFVGSSGIKEKNKSYFDVQTLVSQRLPD
jgi:prepilin-type N-terminal cleavage/methylation domain-containing protein